MSGMTREQLRQLSKDELIDIILRQQEIIELQQARIEQLEARVAQLEAQIERLTGPPKDHTNSSVPPSKSRKPNRDSPGQSKRGPKKGHRGHSRKRQEPDIRKAFVEDDLIESVVLLPPAHSLTKTRRLPSASSVATVPPHADMPTGAAIPWSVNPEGSWA
jgi:hypothetical protein